MRLGRKNELERIADDILSKYLKDKRKNKSRLEEYPILSDDQLLRRYRREISFSHLSMRQKQMIRSKGVDLSGTYNQFLYD